MPLSKIKPRSLSARNVIILSYNDAYREINTNWHQKAQYMCNTMNYVDNGIIFHGPRYEGALL
jgi:hypothetical protein